MTDERTIEVRQVLDEIESTLGTLGKMAHDIEPSYCVGADFSRVKLALVHLNEAEDKLADVCADTNEREEDAAE